MNNKKQLKDYAPLGINLKWELIGYWMCIASGILYSSTFLFDYQNAWNALYCKDIYGKRVIEEGAQMLPFEDLIAGRMYGFVFVAIILVVWTVGHYAYHYGDQGSKSIYLMKRLPDKWELHKRCLTLPVIGAVIAVLVVVLLLGIYLGVYLIFTPQVCLPY